MGECKRNKDRQTLVKFILLQYVSVFELKP